MGGHVTPPTNEIIVLQSNRIYQDVMEIKTALRAPILLFFIRYFPIHQPFVAKAARPEDYAPISSPAFA